MDGSIPDAMLHGNKHTDTENGNDNDSDMEMVTRKRVSSSGFRNSDTKQQETENVCVTLGKQVFKFPISEFPTRNRIRK